VSQLKPLAGTSIFSEGEQMTSSLKLCVVATALVAVMLAGGPAGAQKPQRRPLQPPPGTGRLHNAAQDMCLDVAGWAAQGDANVRLGECDNDPDHVWSFSSAGELRNALAGTCLDAAGWAGEQGANIDAYRCENLDDQRWTLVARGRGKFELRNAKNGLCLDVKGRAGARGDNLLLGPCDGAADQLWSFEPYAAPQRLVVNLTSPVESRQRPRPMEDGPFNALVGSVRGESFSDAQLTVVQQAAVRNNFQIGQVKSLIEAVPLSSSKLRVLELCASRIVDPENAFSVYEAFAFSADKDKARQILRRAGI
jgi:hypothetical protein